MIFSFKFNGVCRLAKALSGLSRPNQEDEQIITAKLTELKFREINSELGWPVLFIFNDCELVGSRMVAKPLCVCSCRLIC